MLRNCFATVLCLKANVLRPKYVKKSLSQSELRVAKEVMIREYPDHFADFN